MHTYNAYMQKKCRRKRVFCNRYILYHIYKNPSKVLKTFEGFLHKKKKVKR